MINTSYSGLCNVALQSLRCQRGWLICASLEKIIRNEYIIVDYRVLHTFLGLPAAVT